MKFIIEVGQSERHRIEYNFNQLLGRLVVKIDEQPVKKSVRLINEPSVEVHVFSVGQFERMEIRIEQERKQLFGHRNRVFVDNRLVKVLGNN